MKDRSHLPCTDPEEVKKARDDLDSMKVGSESGPYKGWYGASAQKTCQLDTCTLGWAWRQGDISDGNMGLNRSFLNKKEWDPIMVEPVSHIWWYIKKHQLIRIRFKYDYVDLQQSAITSMRRMSLQSSSFPWPIQGLAFKKGLCGFHSWNKSETMKRVWLYRFCLQESWRTCVNLTQIFPKFCSPHETGMV